MRTRILTILLLLAALPLLAATCGPVHNLQFNVPQYNIFAGKSLLPAYFANPGIPQEDFGGRLLVGVPLKLTQNGSAPGAGDICGADMLINIFEQEGAVGMAKLNTTFDTRDSTLDPACSVDYEKLSDTVHSLDVSCPSAFKTEEVFGSVIPYTTDLATDPFHFVHLTNAALTRCSDGSVVNRVSNTYSDVTIIPPAFPVGGDYQNPGYTVAPGSSFTPVVEVDLDPHPFNSGEACWATVFVTYQQLDGDGNPIMLTSPAPVDLHFPNNKFDDCNVLEATSSPELTDDPDPFNGRRHAAWAVDCNASPTNTRIEDGDQLPSPVFNVDAGAGSSVEFIEVDLYFENCDRNQGPPAFEVLQGDGGTAEVTIQ